MTPEQRHQATRLLVALEYGEQLAQRCALHQSTLVTNSKAANFLRAQARQEHFHAFLFHQAAGWLSPKHHIAVPKALQCFGRSLDQALQRNDLAECLVGSQIVLEGFGEQILIRLNRSLDDHNIGFKRQRRLILHQEQSHCAFGIRTLKIHLEQEHTRIERIHTLADKYLHLARSITQDLADLFSVLDADPNEYIESMTNDLPSWLFRPTT